MKYVRGIGVGAHQPTDQPTDQQTGQKQYVPHYYSEEHKNGKINVASRVLTRKNAPPPGGHVFQPTSIIFELVQDIIGMNLLTKKNSPPLGSHVFQANVTIFKLIQDIIESNLLTKFHEDWTINVASGVLIRKNAPPPGGHIFQPTSIIFELVQDIIRMNFSSDHEKCPAPWRPYIIESNLLTKFHEDWTIYVASRVLTRKNAPPPGGHVFQPTGIISNSLLTKFHEDRTINVASREKNAPPLGSHVLQANVSIFELIQDILKPIF
ncbi:hypothetical protein DPMN_016280 [Dreissena polymorpha]|uniref:Uncharacterized protein n=1 Tax=Dreissena polymorpha TaxID=45954 RepID=A0A9D4S6E2_DREPO|nr:hypothetical protein DPMN_016280 [Dreissena polymorpha]